MLYLSLWRYSYPYTLEEIYVCVCVSPHQSSGLSWDVCFSLAGEQNGKGFYVYDDKRKARPAPEVKDFIKQSQEDAGIMPNGKVRVPFDYCHMYAN